MNLLFETKRLYIRKATLQDRDEMYEMLHDPVILKYNCITPPTHQEVETYIEKTSQDDKRYVMEHKDSHQVIGEVHLSPDSLRYDANSVLFSYHLNTQYVGKGYMSEALRGLIDYCFQVRKVDLISARVFTPNIRSNELLKRLGFTLEGTLRHAVKAYQDIIYDDNLYSLTKEDYLDKKRME